MTCPTFPEHEIQTEKGVVIDEIHSYKDSPSEDIFDTFEEMLFKGPEPHPLSGRILGTAASVRKITRDELLKFVKEKFTPGKMAFTVVADIDEEKMKKDTERKIKHRGFHCVLTLGLSSDFLPYALQKDRGSIRADTRENSPLLCSSQVSLTHCSHFFLVS